MVLRVCLLLTRIICVVSFVLSFALCHSCSSSSFIFSISCIALCNKRSENLHSILHSIKVAVCCWQLFVCEWPICFNCVSKKKKNQKCSVQTIVWSYDDAVMSLCSMQNCFCFNALHFFTSLSSSLDLPMSLNHLSIHCVVILMTLGRFFRILKYFSSSFFCRWCKILNDYPMSHIHTFKAILRLWLADEIIYRWMTKLNNCPFFVTIWHKNRKINSKNYIGFVSFGFSTWSSKFMEIMWCVCVCAHVRTYGDQFKHLCKVQMNIKWMVRRTLRRPRSYYHCRHLSIITENIYVNTFE